MVENQKLLEIESMKMENPIISTIKGIVKDIQVKKGDIVATKQVLLVIEEG